MLFSPKDKGLEFGDWKSDILDLHLQNEVDKPPENKPGKRSSSKKG